MQKTILYVSVALVLSACGGGSSGDSQSTSGTNGGTLTNEITNSGGTAETDNTSSGTVVNGETTGSSTVDNVTTTVPVTPSIGSSAGVNQLGVVNVDVYDGVEFDATFFSISEQIPFADLQGEFRPATDTCTVESFDIGVIPDITDISDLSETLDKLEVSLISAGEVLTISSPAGSYAELLRRQEFGFTIYSSDDNVELTAPAPTNLSINIPGDEFPAFTNISFPAIEPLEVSSPGIIDPITASTTFNWTGSANPDSFMEIFAVGINDDFTSTVIVDCVVKDDGSFAFSAATQAELGSFTGSGSFDRYALKIVEKGNSVLVISVLSERVN